MRSNLDFDKSFNLSELLTNDSAAAPPSLEASDVSLDEKHISCDIQNGKEMGETTASIGAVVSIQSIGDVLRKLWNNSDDNNCIGSDVSVPRQAVQHRPTKARKKAMHLHSKAST